MGDFIGSPNHEVCSIPQGCPFSMALVALITRIWVNVMEMHHVEPRCLADDLMFTAQGTGHLTRTLAGMMHSRQFFTDMGAKVATTKCFTFPHVQKHATSCGPTAGTIWTSSFQWFTPSATSAHTLTSRRMPMGAP